MTSTEERDTGLSDLLTSRMADVQASGIDFFNRAVARPDREADAHMMREAAENALRKLTAGERGAILAHLRADVEEEMRDRERQILSFLDAVLNFACTNFSPAKLYGVRFALNLPSVAGTTQSDAARRLGVERATISVHAVAAMRTLGLKPAEQMRSVSTINASRQARIAHCQPATL